MTVAPTYFATAEEFRAWLERHHQTASELIVGYHKVGSGRPSMTWPESVDEALCFGWIDGVRRRLSDTAYQIRFTPRRPKSMWSAINLARVEVLQAEGRMHAAGLEAYAQRESSRCAGYAYEQRKLAELPAAEIREFRRHAAAWRYYQSTPPGYRQTLNFWILNAKQPETRARRLAKLIDACAREQRLR